MQYHAVPAERHIKTGLGIKFGVDSLFFNAMPKAICVKIRYNSKTSFSKSVDNYVKETSNEIIAGNDKKAFFEKCF